MAIGTWFIAGLIMGYLANKLIVRTGEGLMRDIGLGVGGAALAGALFGAVTTPDASVINVFGLIVTLAGASAALVVYHTMYPHVRAG